MTEESNASTNSSSQQSAPELGRNEPCHCGSGKKFKRCHGVGAAPKLSTPKPTPSPAGGPGAGGAFPGGFDPSKMDPQMMQQFTQALQRLPRGQLQKLQGIMQRAMGGKDVSRESEEFERTLPPELQQLMISFAGQMQASGAMPGVPGMPAAAAQAPGPEGMSEEQARKIVADAAAEGKISKEEAEKLLSAPPGASEEEKKSRFGKQLKALRLFTRGISGKSS